MTRYFTADFETTVYSEQTSTDVWASAIVEMYTDDVFIDLSIEAFMERVINMLKKTNIVVYFHNAKFDCSFILDWILKNGKYNHAFEWADESESYGEFTPNRFMKNRDYKYLISADGSFYTMTIKRFDHILEFRDSLKLLPYSVDAISKAFSTRQIKGIIQYNKYREPNNPITEEEREYIKCDVLIIKDAMEHMFDNGHDRLTIGSCCLWEFKQSYGKTFDFLFPDLSTHELNPDEYGAFDVDGYVRKSYRGAWVYLKPDKRGIQKNGLTADVNSEYPFVMHSVSGYVYPTGEPYGMCSGDVPEYVKEKNENGDYKYYWFQRFRCTFRIRNNHLPFYQIKNSYKYVQNECLTTSEVENNDGVLEDIPVEITMCMYELELFRKHYRTPFFEILDSMWFVAEKGLFDDYVDKYTEMKVNAETSAERSEAKLFQNNLYGKLATSTDSSFKVAYLNGDKVGFRTVSESNKKAGYIPCGSAIIAHARINIISHAQENYDKFVYADTDSLHLSDCTPEDLVNIDVHPRDLGKWKLESSWDVAKFVRQKTYIEHVTHENLEPIDKPFYSIKCSGMPKGAKDIFTYQLENGRDIDDFDIGLHLPKCLKPKRICGGVLLEDVGYRMR